MHDDDLDDLDDLGDQQWTEPAAAAFRAAADELRRALQAHAETLLALAGSPDPTLAVFESNETLSVAVRAFVDAQFEFTGAAAPFQAFDDDDEDDEEDDEESPAVGVSVRLRADYRVLDEDAVLAAGRRAYSEAWPQDTGAAAEADVTDVERAVYQLLHAAGQTDALPALHGVDGLRHDASAMLVVRTDGRVDDPGDWPEDPFAGTAAPGEGAAP